MVKHVLRNHPVKKSVKELRPGRMYVNTANVNLLEHGGLVFVMWNNERSIGYFEKGEMLECVYEFITDEDKTSKIFSIIR